MPNRSQPTALEAALADLPSRYPPRRRYLVGVSGGRDSVVLLDALSGLGYRRLVVAHLNHGLRGRASGQDAAFVRRLAQSYGFSAVVEKCRVSGSEESGRVARLAFFASHGRRVFLAHHAGDQVETVLMNFLRGGGTAGLAGMREASCHRGLELLRPLLGVAPAALAEHAQVRRLRFREDASNTDRRFLRNRVRHDLLPMAEAVMGRPVREAILRGAEVAREDAELIARLSQDAYRDAVQKDQTLSAKALLAQPIAVQRGIIRTWLQEAGARDVGFAEIEETRLLADPGSAVSRRCLPGAKLVRRRAGRLSVTHAPPPADRPEKKRR